MTLSNVSILVERSQVINQGDEERFFWIQAQQPLSGSCYSSLSMDSKET